MFSVILSTGTGSLISERVRLDTSPKLEASLFLLVILLSLRFSALVAAFEG